MAKILVVEGDTDVAFFRGLVGLLGLPEAEVVFRKAGGKYKIPDVIRALLEVQVTEFAVAQDIDGGSPEQTVQSVRQVVFTSLGVALPRGTAPERRIVIQDRTVTVDVIPMGLYQDAVLKELGVTSHAMDDYLIKLLLEDANLRQDVPQLKSLLLQILPVIRHHDGLFPRGKDLFQLIKPMVQHSFSDTGVVHSLFARADPRLLRSVLAPVLADLQQALSL